MAQISTRRISAPRRNIRNVRSLSGLADDWLDSFFSSSAAADMNTSSSFDWDSSPVVNEPVYGSFDAGAAQSPTGSLETSGIAWEKILPGLFTAGLSVYQTSKGAETMQEQAKYGIAPAGYTYRGQSQSTVGAYGSAMPAGYSATGQPVTYQPASVGGMSNTTLLLLLAVGGGAAYFLSKKRR